MTKQWDDLELKEILRKYYLTILEREPDATGMEFYLNKIKNNEISLESISLIFKNSQEFINLQERKLKDRKNQGEPFFSMVDNVAKKVIDEHVLYFDPNDKVLCEIFSKNEYEPATTKAVKKLVKPGMNVINIGANIGYFTLLIARQVGPKGSVISFEPGITTANFLQQNVDANGYKNVKVHVKAVSNKTGKSDLWVGGSSTHSFVSELRTQSYPQLKKTQIETVTIDDFLGSDTKIDFVMMDAEGSEKYIFEGMKKTIEQNPDLEIITEYNPFTFKLAETSPESFLDLIKEMGFFIYVIDDKDSKVKRMGKNDIIKNFPIPNLTNLYLTRKTKTMFDT
ncbi:MAG: FkbM family methyltransferase [Nitrosopumilaceae archaeon]